MIYGASTHTLSSLTCNCHLSYILFVFFSDYIIQLIHMLDYIICNKHISDSL
jgi:hypothetical protein